MDRTAGPDVFARIKATQCHVLNSPAEPMAFGKINVYAEGTCNVLVVAPHGFAGDDMNTEVLGHLLARNLDACAVINNQKYRKPREGDPDCSVLAVRDPRQLTDEHTRVREKFIAETMAVPVDLNRWPDAATAAVDYFLPVLLLAGQLGKKLNPLVLFVHGIADRNRMGGPNPDFVVGAGYELSGKRRAFASGKTTAREHVVNELVEALKNMDHSGPYWVEEGFPGYAAAKRIRMPWIFTIMKEGGRWRHSAAHVDAVQLEVRHTGFRDEPNLPKTASQLADAVRGLRAFEKL